MKTDYQTFRDTKLFRSLNGLRCLGILAVIWHHSGNDLTPSPGLLCRGALGVQLFFAISGFLITTLLLREKESQGGISLKHFYVRRGLRILPLYYTVLLLYCVLVFLKERHSQSGELFFTNLTFYATYTSNWFVRLSGQHVIFFFAWAVATEVQFYLLWPSIEKFSGRRLDVLTACGLIAISATVDTGCWSDWIAPDSVLRRILGSFSIPIYLGVILAHALHNPATFGWFKKILGWRCSPIAVLGVILFLASGSEFTDAERLLVYGGMVALVASCVIREDHCLAPLLNWKPLQTIGVVSYGMYLTHMLAAKVTLIILHHLSINWRPVIFALVTLLAFGVSWLSYRYYEQFFLSLKRRFARSD